MRISHAIIANFRALQSISVPLNQFSVLIGENDAGKTSFLQALDKFFAHKKIDNERDWYKYEKSNDIRIVLTFSDVPDDGKLKPLQRKDGTIVISKVFAHAKAPDTKAILDDNAAIDVPKGVLEQWFSANSFHLIPVRRDLAVQFSMTKTALLGKTLRARMKSKLDAGDGAVSIEELERTLAEAIEEPKKVLQQYLREQMRNDAIEIGFENLEIDPLEGVGFEVCLSDDRIDDVVITNRGAGTQNNLIIALFRLVAELDLPGYFVLAMEEPENSLHPKAQRQLLGVLQDISAKSQVIVTTHSPVFIDRSRFENNILLTRTKPGNTVGKSFDESQLADLRTDLGIRASDALLKGGGNCALIVEGPTEEDGFPVFMEMLGMSEFGLGIAIVNIEGSDFEKVRKTAQLLKAYDIPCVIALDNDAEKYLADIKKVQEKSLRNIKHAICWSLGAIEDYYPLEVVAEIMNSEFKPEKAITPADFDDTKHGQARHKDFNRVMHEHGIGTPLGFLKRLLGSKGTRLMQQRGFAVPAEIAAFLEEVKKVAEA